MDKGLLLIYAFFSFSLGASIASFLNVVIWRVPRGESIVSPPSHCPKCNAPIKWYQNIPILAWLFLRGKCATCKAPISPRYILVETLGGVLFLAVFLHYFVFIGAPLVDPAAWILVLVCWIWLSLMIVGSMIDYDLQLLPDFVTVGGMILGLVANGFLCFVYWPLIAGKTGFLWERFLLEPVLGLAFGFGLLWLIRWIGGKVFKREAMGMGDVFLMGAVGALFGPVAVLFVLIGSSVFGSLAGVVMIALAKARLGRLVAIPYGPYICLACLVWMFRGPQVVNWYLNLLGFR